MSIIDLQGPKYASLIRDASETCQISKIECFMNIVNSPQTVLIEFFSHAPTMLSTQTSKDKNTILVYHSFPMKPCVVGFMSAIISTFIHEDSNVILVPYWRVDECFQNVKHAITKMRYKSTSIMSVDCTPEPENETKFLCENLTSLTVYKCLIITQSAKIPQLNCSLRETVLTTILTLTSVLQ